MSRHDRPRRRPSIGRVPRSADAIRTMHDVFPDPYRCAVLYYLQRTDRAVTLRELATAIAAWRPDGDAPGNRHGGSHGEFRTWLRDEHVRPMDDFGVIEYDADADVLWLPEDVAVSVTPPWTVE